MGSSEYEEGSAGDTIDFLHEQMSRRRALTTMGKAAVVAGAVVVIGGGSAAYFLTQPSRPTGPPKPDRVTIAYFAQILNLDPHIVPQANLVQYSPHEAIFDNFQWQDQNLKYHPGIIDSWSWAPDEAGSPVLEVKVRQGVKFHNGDPLTAEDVAFSMERLSKPPSSFAGVFGVVKEGRVTGTHSARLIFKFFNPAFPVWFSFISGYVIPKKYFNEVGAAKFAEAPIGSGPYKFKRFVRDSVLEVEAFDDYWRGRPAIKSVVWKIVPDPISRATEMESGSSDVTYEVPIREFERLSANPNLKAVKQPIADVAFLMIPPYSEALSTKNRRIALHTAIDKESLTRDVLRGFGVPISTLEAPGYVAFDANYRFPFDPARARQLLEAEGFSASKPLKITAATTSGYRTQDAQIMQAIVEMWSKINVQTDLITLSSAEDFYARRDNATLTDVAINFWSNASADPQNSTGFAMWPESPFSAFFGSKQAKRKETGDWPQMREKYTARIGPLITGFPDRDENKRLELSRAVAKEVMEDGLAIPLYQNVQPVVFKKNLVYQPSTSGMVKPHDMSWG